jgi:hypothetical protein
VLIFLVGGRDVVELCGSYFVLLMSTPDSVPWGGLEFGLRADRPVDLKSGRFKLMERGGLKLSVHGSVMRLLQ